MSFSAIIIAPSIVAKLADCIEMDEAIREPSFHELAPVVRKRAHDSFDGLVSRLGRAMTFSGIGVMEERDYHELYRRAGKIVDSRRAQRKYRAQQRKAARLAAAERQLELSEGILA